MYNDIDIPLFHNIDLIDDWKVFGTLKFNAETSTNTCIKIWYDLIRGIERHSRGQWLLRIEGSSYNDSTPKRHIHYLIAETGIKKEFISILPYKIKTKLLNLKNTYFGYYKDVLDSSTSHIEQYDPSLGAKHYISKMNKYEPVNASVKGLDSGGNSSWKLSPSIKRRITKINQTLSV